MLLKDWIEMSGVILDAQETQEIGEDIGAKIIKAWYGDKPGENMVLAGDTLAISTNESHVITSVDRLWDEDFLDGWESHPVHYCKNCRYEITPLTGVVDEDNNVFYCDTCARAITHEK
jgi:hypothetical protein